MKAMVLILLLATTGVSQVAGVTAIDTSAAEPTVRVADADIVPSVAVRVAEPTPELVATPCDPDVLLTTATVASEVDHATFVVRSFVLLSVYVPVAVNG